jgi:hypothetical protein
MENRDALDFVVVGQSRTPGHSQRAHVVAAWQRLRSQYKRGAGPKMFATYTPVD